jgi:phosphate uptake regulator
MKRKVIKQANQAYTITLPIDWARKHNLDKNPEIDVLESGKSLIISSDNAVKGESLTIDASEWEEKSFNTVVSALYARGADEITFISKQKICREILSEISGRFLGYALVAQEGGKYTIKDISGANFSNLDEIFKRVFQMIISFYNSAINDVFGEEKETMQRLDSRDVEVNRFCLYLERAINKMSYHDSINGRILFTYSFDLEKISDEVHRLWRTNIKYKVKKSKQLKDLALMSKECLEMAFDIYYNANQNNPKLVSKLYNQRNKLRELSMALAKNDAITTRFIRHIVKIAEDAADLSHLALMKQSN